MELVLVSAASSKTKRELTPKIRGIGVTVVAKSATQLMIPQTRVAVPSFIQLSAGEPINQ